MKITWLLAGILCLIVAGPLAARQPMKSWLSSSRTTSKNASSCDRWKHRCSGNIATIICWMTYRRKLEPMASAYATSTGALDQRSSCERTIRRWQDRLRDLARRSRAEHLADREHQALRGRSAPSAAISTTASTHCWLNRRCLKKRT